MLIDHIREPDLEFGSGIHVDTRFGLMNLGPLDVNLSEAPHTIKVGMCGTRETIEGAISWINKCRSEIEPKPSPPDRAHPRGAMGDPGSARRRPGGEPPDLRCELVSG